MTEGGSCENTDIHCNRFVGGGFDEFKLDGYRRELTIRVSSMDHLRDMIAAVERNVNAAQSNDGHKP